MCSGLRHELLQSNGFDLGIYDQVAWQLAHGLEPRSSLLGLHHLGNHAAWGFGALALPYAVQASPHWLLLIQALALAFTALPLAELARQHGLNQRLQVAVALLWWLQPQVFNANLFDFHPEVMAMPALAGCLLVRPRSHPSSIWLWLALLAWLLACRDGLALVVMGLGLREAVLGRHKAALIAAALGCGWILMLSQWLYPWLNGPGRGPAALQRFSHLGSSIPEILMAALVKPQQFLLSLQPGDILIYLVLISASTALFWRRASLATLLAALPLVAVNAISSSASQRDLVHHYNLPIAVIAVAAACEGLAAAGQRAWPWRRLGLSALLWAALAKPWFFTGPYLTRLPLQQEFQQVKPLISADAAVLTNSHLAPHLSHRRHLYFMGQAERADPLKGVDTVLLQPPDPGWASSTAEQRRLLHQLQQNGWNCRRWPSQLELCRKP